MTYNMIYDMMTGLNNITGKEFPAWEQSVSSVETGRSQRGNSVDSAVDAREMQGRSTLVGAWLRCVVMLLLMMTVGANGAWGQTAQTGISGAYYIANYLNYNSSDHSKCWYMVPAKDPTDENCADAYYSPNCSTCNDEKPFITTYQTNRNDDGNSVWILKEVDGESGYYYIIHAMTGKNLVYEPPFANYNNRKSFHLQTQSDLVLDNTAKFEITNVPSTVNAWSENQRLIRIQKLTTGNRYLNPAGDQTNNYHATGGGTPGHYLGLVGVYSEYDGTGNNVGRRNSRWYLESALMTAPTISAVDPTTSKVTITETNGLPDGYNIRYTFGDGSQDAPTATTGTLIENVSSASPGEILISESGVLKVVIVRYGVVLTNVATSGTLEPSLPDAPTITENCDNTFSLSCGNIPSSSIYYNLTTDGTEPDAPTTNSTPYDGTPVPFATNYWVKAIAVANNNTSLTVASQEFTTIHTAAPTITYNASASAITITGPEGSTIYYTTNGVDPEIGGEDVTNDASPIELSYNGTSEVEIRAIAKVENLKVSCVARYVTLTAPAVTMSTDDCSTASPRGNVLTITGPDDGRTFWYAVTAGSGSTAPDPTAVPNSYRQYTLGTPVSIDDLADANNANCTVHAYAMNALGDRSAITSVNHALKTSSKPLLTPPTGSSNTLDISNGTAGDKVLIVSDNDTPDDDTDDVDYTTTANLTIGADRTATFNIPNSATGTLTVQFQRGNWLPSCEATYTIPGAPPTPTWSQDSDNKLSLSCEDDMAVIHYTIDGTEPTMSSPTYNPGSLDNIAVGTTVKAIAVRGFRYSDVMTYTYQHTHVEAPEFFVEGNQVTITAPEGATIYYTVSTNGNNNEQQAIADPANPTAIPANLYSGAYTLTGITKIKAIAVKDGLGTSSIAFTMTREGYTIDGTKYTLSSMGAEGMEGKYFFLSADITAPSNYTSVTNFTGVLVGNNHTISGLKKPLFNTATNAVIHDVNLKDITISESGDAGAFANTATGTTRIYNCGILPTNADGASTSTVSGTDNVGGIVGELSGDARVINCFSYANITGGDYRGGIVGKNNVETKSNNLAVGGSGGTMVMNCMFYGDIIIGENDNPTSIAPIYGGNIISNKRTNNTTDTGLNNFNYFYFNRDYVGSITNYNCALGAEERFLNRFEFFRQTLNSTRDLAAWYVSGEVSDKDLMAKWVLDKSIAPYPILKAPKDQNGQTIKYPSVMNPDAEHAVAIDADNEHRNEGRKLGTLKVNISLGSGGKVFNNSGATLKAGKSTITLNITDKDPDNFNFNYKKVQLPYYNEVGNGNYGSDNTNNYVVTGWKITNIITSNTSDPYTAANYDYTQTYTNDNRAYFDAPNFNFVNRKSSNKDLYSVSGRIFNQGAYWEVPEGVTEITIEPYWAKCVFLSDAYYDHTYSGANKYNVTVVGTRPTTFEGATVYTEFSTAFSSLSSDANNSVYDYAVVLVGNYHKYFDATTPTGGDNAAILPVTIMSADTDGDNEPDNTFFYQHKERRKVGPIRFDFINVPGIGTVKRTYDSDENPQPGIFWTKAWFEITNTTTIRFGQFEYSKGDVKTVVSPCILQGGVYEQFLSTREYAAQNTNYLLVGGNAWFNVFNNGCHTRAASKSAKIPINVTGGEFKKFYLSGINRPETNNDAENAECYIDGGKFGEVAGAGMQEIKGDVTWLINGADIDDFYGGGINAAKAITGDVSTTISNSYVTHFYGGPKFGDMKTGKTVITLASDCVFDTFYGAGYGGTSFNRDGAVDAEDAGDNPAWDSYVTANYTRAYVSGKSGVSTNYDYECLLNSDGKRVVARFYVDYASLSLASTKDVTSTLNNCKMRNFYGGGRLGSVGDDNNSADIQSTLTDCTVTGNVYGAGESATTPTVDVLPLSNFVVAPKYNRTAGVFNNENVKLPTPVTYTWDDDPNNFEDLQSSYFNDTDLLIFTGWTKDENNQNVPISLEGLGKVNGTAKLTINGKSVIGTANDATTGNVYGGGALSNVKDATDVTIDGRTKVLGSVFGGGQGEADDFTCDKAMIGDENSGTGSTSVTINNGTVEGNVYGGGEVGRVEADTEVIIGAASGTSTPTINGNVFGGGAGVETHGYSALTRGHTEVTIQGNAKVMQSVFGGGEIATVGRFYVKNVNDASYDHKNEYDVPTGMPYALISGGDCTVTVQGNAEVTGDVFGAGKGQEPDVFDYMTEAAYQQANPEGSYEKKDHMPRRMVDYDASKYKTTYDENDVKYVWEYFEDDHNFVWEYFDTPDKYKTFLQTLALVNAPEVTIGGSAKVKESVYGGSKSGFVLGTTSVTTQDNCTIGVNGTTDTDGDVFGGGLGLASFAEAGIVKGNTGVTINGGTVKHNIYGGGKLGSVGTYKVSSDMRNFYWTNTPLANINPNDPTTYTYNSTGVCNVTITGGEIGTGVAMSDDGSFANGNVFGAGKGLADTFWCEKAIVYSTNVSVTSGTIKGNVYGGGEVGRIETNATVKIGPDSGSGSPEIMGNVFGGGAGVKTHGYSALTRGNTYVTVQSGAKVGHNVYGGGQIAAVGKYKVKLKNNPLTPPDAPADLPVGMPYSLVSDNLGICNVTVKGSAEITGNVFGGGKGKDPEYNNTPDDEERSKRMVSHVEYNEETREGHNPEDVDTKWNYYVDDNGNQVDAYVWEYFLTLADYHQFLETLGLTTQNVVSIEGSSKVKGNVYGGSESGFVQHNTFVTIKESSTIGVNGTETDGNVFGGGLGLTDFAEAGRVSGNSTVNINGGTVKKNVYGGGRLGPMGNFSYEVNPTTHSKTYTWTTGGICNVNIDALNNNTPIIKGNVFGAGKGSYAKYECEPAMAFHSNVTIKNGTVNGTVYGGGEVGRVDQNTTVTIGKAGDSTSEPDIKGDVFGAGAGVETHGYSALVRGNSTVTIQGKAKVAKSVYGGGKIASVGRFVVNPETSLPTNPVSGGICAVTIKDNASIGYDGGGDVYGACKGIEPGDWESLPGHQTNDNEGLTKFTSEADYLKFLKTLALTSNTEVSIGGSATINGSVFGGGQRGITLAGVQVNMTGGTVTNDVYGGGALADTNTENWDDDTKTLTKYHKETRLTPTSYQEKTVEAGTSVKGLYTRTGSEGAYTYTETDDDDVALDGETYYENLGSSLAGYYTLSNGKYIPASGTPVDNVDYYRFTDTKVNLLGGTIGGNAYGGGLGRLAAEAQEAVYTVVESGTTLTEGKTYYTLNNEIYAEHVAGANEVADEDQYYVLTTPASDAVSAVEAFVYGDTKVNLNGLDADDYIESIHSNYVHAVGSPATEYALKTTTSGEGANAVTTYPKGAIVNQIFGCNNLNGSPKGHVKVHVFATQSPDASHNRLNLKYPKRPVQGENDTENSKETSKQYLQRLINATHVDGDTNKDLLPGITENVINAAQTTCSNNSATETEINTAITAVQQELCKLYDVEAVYGGGNLAAYEPASSTDSTEVRIDGCDLTSIKEVYGGGNAASAPATFVRVNEAYEINEAFGGGNGFLNLPDGRPNPGAHVGYHNYSTYNEDTHVWVDNSDALTPQQRKTSTYCYGSGIARIEITGGTIHAAYGGSNTKGNVREKAISVYQEAGDCPLQIDESYGGGKNSPMDAEVAVNLDCVQNMDIIYGGSKNADVYNNITLNITNGTFQKVFGGNNTSGAINGAITVNIEERGSSSESYILEVIRLPTLSTDMRRMMITTMSQRPSMVSFNAKCSQQDHNCITTHD